MYFDKLISKKYGPYIIIFAAALTVYGLIYLFSDGFGVTAHNWWNNYSRQAYSWLQGRLDLPENRPYLETVTFEGRYYVSFPPFPSVVLLPFVAIFGYNTPDQAVALAFALLSVLFSYKIAQTLLPDKKQAIFFSLFLVLGTNYLHISLWGSVWYLAQNMAFAFTLMAFYFALSKSTAKYYPFLALFFMCAAMGSRPFNIVYLPVLIWLIYRRESAPRPLAFIINLLLYAIPAMVLGSFFIWLNYVRFGNIFEFGHNFLPEFLMDPYGQFHISRVAHNMSLMFLELDITHGILYGFPFLGQVGFAFWLASPIVLSFVFYIGLWLKGMIRPFGSSKLPKFFRNDENKERPLNDPLVWVILAAVALHLFLFSLHRTLGGRQFGSRYAIDALPGIYLGLMLVLNRLRLGFGHIYLNAVPMAFGLLINFHGSIMFFMFYFSEIITPWT